MFTLMLIFQLLMGGGDAIKPQPPGDYIFVTTIAGPNPLPPGAERGGKPPWFGGILSTYDGPWIPW